MSFFGGKPTPSNFYGSEVRDPERWNIGPIRLSVDDTWEQGISYVVEDFYWGASPVSFGPGYGGVPYEARAFEIQCANGPTVRTGECLWSATRSWTGTGVSRWTVKDAPSNFDMYGYMPVAGEDYSLPEKSGRLDVKCGEYVLGSAYLGGFASRLPSS